RMRQHYPRARSLAAWTSPACTTLPMRVWMAPRGAPWTTFWAADADAPSPAGPAQRTRPQTMSPPRWRRPARRTATVAAPKGPLLAGEVRGRAYQDPVDPGCTAHLGAAARQRPGSPRALPGDTLRTSLDLAGHLPQGRPRYFAAQLHAAQSATGPAKRASP